MAPAIEQQSTFRAAILGTFLPRRCGIATFTADLADAIEGARPGAKVDAYAISDRPYDYPPRVAGEIAVDDRLAYGLAAIAINRERYDVLSVQHEYGIFGGIAGASVLDLVRAANMPVVTTLHTVLQHPTPEQFTVLEELLQLSTRVVVMSRTAIQLLRELHGNQVSKVQYIPHGIPFIPANAGAAVRDRLPANPMLLTFGLLSPDKGIEDAIGALPSIAQAYPGVRYLVVGATHPHIVSVNGESYRESLVALANELGVQEHVVFIDEFVSLERLVALLSATDFYITPYRNPMQITSGTLAYSLGAGKVVISTPYVYAQEVLAEGRGILVPFRDPEAIAAAVLAACAAPETRDQIGARAAAFGADMYWDRVGALYAATFQRAIEEERCVPGPACTGSPSALPDLVLHHMETLSDDTGIYQHATFNVPNRNEGYCVDDNARALILTVQLERMGLLTHRLEQMRTNYLAFVAHSFCRETGGFRNFMGFDRTWLESLGSEDSQGRALWALGVTAGHSRNAGQVDQASHVFRLGAPALSRCGSPRAWAYGILGAVAFLQGFPNSAVARSLLAHLATQLDRLFAQEATPRWPWIEGRLAYANARIPQALLLAGQTLGNDAMSQRGVLALAWLMDSQVHRDRFCPVGSAGAGPDDLGKPQFDQQPIEACGAVSACLSAYGTTGDRIFLDRARLAFDWFLGGNVLGQPIADTIRGGCFDGLQLGGVNQNQGAESTLSYLMALAEMRTASEEDDTLRQPSTLAVRQYGAII